MRRLFAVFAGAQRIALVIALEIVLVAAIVSPAHASGFSVTSWHELRWEDVHRQETDVSCGPATLVTLLKGFYALPVSEYELYALAIDAPAGDTTTYAAGDTTGATIRNAGDLTDDAIGAWRATTLAGLARALTAHGFESVGLKMSLEGVKRYFAEVGLPIVAHVHYPKQHFLLVTGVVGDAGLIIDDSSQGTYIQSFADFERRSSGHYLLYVPPLHPDYDRLQHKRSDAAARFEFLQFLQRGGVG